MSKWLVESIMWADGEVTRHIVENKGQGAVDWPQDNIASISYKDCCLPSGGISCGDCTFEFEETPTSCCGKCHIFKEAK